VQALLEQDIGDRQPNRARDDQTRKRLLARSRLVKHEEHPEQPVHLHFFAQLLLFVAHHALHCPDGAGLVVVVSVTVLGAIAVLKLKTAKRKADAHDLLTGATLAQRTTHEAVFSHDSIVGVHVLISSLGRTSPPCSNV